METRLHTVRRLRDLGGDSFALEVDGPIPETAPGQFYMLRTGECWPVFLPRPFSLYDRSPDGRLGSFLVKAVGPGTRALAGLRPGEQLHLTGPLGRPFDEQVADPVCVAGGIGLAPFLLLARRAQANSRPPFRLLFGGRTRQALAGIDDFHGLARVIASTDDGSFGHHGLVTQLLDALLQRGEVKAGETVFCCGPDPMMHAVAKLCAQRQLRCFLSLETYMACGYGVCNGCSVRVQGARFRGWPYSKTCVEGPVYEASELVH
ncbi:MAG TPA: dihydroorotate dehydrogenase electron transfer subunit [Planctomycetota bacterium]|nr:dihydroorotate dehydrogenase electron transfer subunit [Planctomycetota bacterium]